MPLNNLHNLLPRAYTGRFFVDWYLTPTYLHSEKVVQVVQGCSNQ